MSTTCQPIANVPAPLVWSALAREPYGTYVIRSATKNDQIISSIRLPSKSIVQEPFAVLSVRVDETIYRCPVMHYYLPFNGSFSEQSLSNILEIYRQKADDLPRFTSLTNRCVINDAETIWNLNPRQIVADGFKTGGSNGKNNAGVSAGQWRPTRGKPLKVFIKRFSKNSSSFKDEFEILRHLSFFPIIGLYGRYTEKNYNYLVFAHAGKSLESIAPLRRSSKSSVNYLLANIGFQIANGMMYLEKLNIVHRDLTAGNVLLDEDGHVRIADFGHAIHRSEGKNHISRTMTYSGQNRFQLRFLAPECCSAEIPSDQSNGQSNDQYSSFSSKSDVWSYGILLVQLMLDKPQKPYPEIDDDYQVKAYVSKGGTHPKPAMCNMDLYLLLQQCWTYEKTERISFSDLREKMLGFANVFR